MVIADTEPSQTPMVDSRFKTAAFMSFFFPILRIFGVSTIIVVSLNKSAFLNLIMNTPLTIVVFVFDIYILLQLKRLLVERHRLHNMSNLINIIIGTLIYIHIVTFFIRISLIPAPAPNPGTAGSWIWILLLFGFLLLGITSIVFGVKLLGAKDLPSGLYQTYAKLYIAGYVCLFTIILSPIGGLSFMASDVVLGLIFLKESEIKTEVEFV